MADYKWIRENVRVAQDDEQAQGRQIGDVMANMVAEGWKPVAAAPDLTYTDTVLVLMHRDETPSASPEQPMVAWR